MEFLAALIILLGLVVIFREYLFLFIINNYWTLLWIIIGAILLFTLFNIKNITEEISFKIKQHKKKELQKKLKNEFKEKFKTSFPEDNVYIYKKEIGVDVNFFQRYYTVSKYCFVCIENYEIHFNKREDLLEWIEIWRKDGIDIPLGQ